MKTYTTELIHLQKDGRNHFSEEKREVMEINDS